MKKWNLVIDVALCNDCNNCFLSDKDEFTGNDFLPYSVAQPWEGARWMNIERKERGQYPLIDVAYLPTPCMHCDEAPCLTADGAVYKRDDGLVIIDPEKAKGKKEILDSCPYGVIYWNEERQVAQKCTGCAHLIDEGWTETRCSQVCPTGAIKLVLTDDGNVAEEGLEAYLPELGTKPRVLYKNLYKWTKSFIAGTVAYKDTDECAEGAAVTLSQNGTKIAEAKTTNYGDFRFDKLDPGAYEVTVTAGGYKDLVQKVDLKESINLGVIFLQK
ncbi:MAG: 4Fe-4S dicluster domain-containing protein [Thermoleophilia bacterium]|jgi:Fe-S-cluster-containing dehydrogenase component